MARVERSAGVIIYRTTSGGERTRLFLLLDYGRHWDFPKGHVEQGEDDTTAALRELAEETGITDATLDPTFNHEITYYFRDKKGRLIRKTVVFFLGETKTGKVKLSHEHVGCDYLPFDEAVRKVTYTKARQLLRLAGEHLALTASGSDVVAADKVS